MGTGPGMSKIGEFVDRINYAVGSAFEWLAEKLIAVWKGSGNE